MNYDFVFTSVFFLITFYMNLFFIYFLYSELSTSFNMILNKAHLYIFIYIYISKQTNEKLKIIVKSCVVFIVVT